MTQPRSIWPQPSDPGRAARPAGSMLLGSSSDSVAALLALGAAQPSVVAIPRRNGSHRRRARSDAVASPARPFEADELLPVMDQCLLWVLGRKVRCLDLLLDEETPLRELRTVKTTAKRLCAGACSRPWRGLTRAVYFTAIAAALVHHDDLISKKPMPELIRVMRLLAGSHCLPPAWRPIIVEAYLHLMRRAT
jgi:hypothetical protein